MVFLIHCIQITRLYPRWPDPTIREISYTRPWKRFRHKRPRFALEPAEYDLLKQSVLEGDGWRCQCCGAPKGLQVHHLVRRSKPGCDELNNLITLCASCHRQLHNTRGA